MAEKLLEILIPTLNREKNLIENIELIQTYINNNGFNEEIGIIISDNGSTEDSFRMVESFMNSKCTIEYQLFRQEENIGIEKNSLFLLKNATAKYVMFLGDDDYFTEKFLVLTMSYLRTGEFTGVMPNFFQIDAHKNRISPCRDEISDDKIYGKESLWISMKGHQLSCLIFSRDGVYESYISNVKSNVYPFIYFAAHSLSKGKMVHITREPFQNTIIPKKNFDYSFDNLMGEISVVIDCLPYENDLEKERNIRYIVNYCSRRYCNSETFRNPIKMLNKIHKYNISSGTKKILYETFVISFFKALLCYIRKRLL